MADPTRREQLTADFRARMSAEVDRLAAVYGIPREELLAFARRVLAGEFAEKPVSDRMNVGEV